LGDINGPDCQRIQALKATIPKNEEKIGIGSQDDCNKFEQGSVVEIDSISINAILLCCKQSSFTVLTQPDSPPEEISYDQKKGMRMKAADVWKNMRKAGRFWIVTKFNVPDTQEERRVDLASADPSFLECD